MGCVSELSLHKATLTSETNCRFREIPKPFQFQSSAGKAHGITEGCGTQVITYYSKRMPPEGAHGETHAGQSPGKCPPWSFHCPPCAVMVSGALLPAREAPPSLEPRVSWGPIMSNCSLPTWLTSIRAPHEAGLRPHDPEPPHRLPAMAGLQPEQRLLSMATYLKPKAKSRLLLGPD